MRIEGAVSANSGESLDKMHKAVHDDEENAQKADTEETSAKMSTDSVEVSAPDAVHAEATYQPPETSSTTMEPADADGMQNVMNMATDDTSTTKAQSAPSAYSNQMTSAPDEPADQSEPTGIDMYA